MPKITIRDILDLGINANWFLKDADAEVIGSDGLNYYCILPQVAAANNKPVAGADWQTYWVQYGYDGKVWADGTSYKTPFTAFVQPVINTESAKLQNRVGSAAYDNADVADDVKRAELCLVATELLRRRINIVLLMVQPGITINTKPEQDQIKNYTDEVNEVLIPKIIEGSPTEGSDFATGALVTDHFGVNSA